MRTRVLCKIVRVRREGVEEGFVDVQLQIQF